MTDHRDPMFASLADNEIITLKDTLLRAIDKTTKLARFAIRVGGVDSDERYCLSDMVDELCTLHAGTLRFVPPAEKFQPYTF